MEKTCNHCGKKFYSEYLNKKYCGQTCYSSFWYHEQKSKRQHKIEELSTEIANLKKALERKNSKANRP